MSTTKRNNQGVFDGERLINYVLVASEGVTRRFEHNVQDQHPSVVFTDVFWRKLQNQLEFVVNQYREMLCDGGYEDVLQDLQAICHVGIRTAVENFRSDMEENPNLIHSSQAWDGFRSTLRLHADEVSSFCSN